MQHFRIVDRSARGEKEPWATYARMEIQRTPKHLTGTDLGVPSLTFRAWYEPSTARWRGRSGLRALFTPDQMCVMLLRSVSRCRDHR